MILDQGFNLYAEYIMWNAGLGETQAGIKIAGRNINNLRYADDTTLMEENEEQLKNLLMKVKEESEKTGLKPNIHKANTMASGSVLVTCSGKQTHSEGQCRSWSAVYYTGRPKAESPLSQGPQSAVVKIFYTPCVCVRTYHPKFLETYIN